MAHRAGDWHLDEDKLDVVDSDGRPICAIMGTSDWEANAALIVAAPKLLAACHAVVKEIDFEGRYCAAVLEQVLEAISNATPKSR